MANAGHDTALVDLVTDLSRPRRVGIMFGRLVGSHRFGLMAARLTRAPMRLRGPTTLFTRFHARVLRLSGGRLRRSWLFAAGQPVMALTTTGRRSGVARTTTVSAFAHGRTLAVAGMNLGMPKNP